MYASRCLFPFFPSQANATTINLPTSTLEIQRFPREQQRSTGAERPERGAGSEPITATVIPQISGVQTCSTVRVLEWKDGVATLPGSNLRVSVALGHRVCPPPHHSPKLLALVSGSPPACGRRGPPGCDVALGSTHTPAGGSLAVLALRGSSCAPPFCPSFLVSLAERACTWCLGGCSRSALRREAEASTCCAGHLSFPSCAVELALTKLLHSPWNQWPCAYQTADASRCTPRHIK